MLLKTLLRFPGLAPSPVALTGDPALDVYLIALDGQLLGGRTNRAGVLAEIRDHLEERRDRLLRAGHPLAEATARAVAEMGPPESHAAPERARLWSRAATYAAVGGLLVATLGLASDLPYGRTIAESLAARAPYLLTTALALAWCMGFAYPHHAMPTARRTTRAFAVAYPRSVLWIFYPLLGFIALTVLGGATVLVLGGVPELGAWGYSAPGAALAIVLGAATIAGLLRVSVRRVEVDDAGLRVVPHIGAARSIRWSAIVSVRDLAGDRRWLPLRRYFASSHAITYRTAGAADRRLYLWPEMVNLDLLVERVRGRRSAAG